MKDYKICKKCASGQRNMAGRKCQACIDNNMYEEKGKEKGVIARK